MSKKVVLRKATLEDSKFIFNLRNKDYVRKNLFNSEKISYSEHKKWFVKNYKYYYIINDKQGCVRVNKKDRSGDVYIAILKKYQKKGLGSEVIRQILNKHKNLTIQVKVNNIASQKLFAKFGFKKVGVILKK